MKTRSHPLTGACLNDLDRTRGYRCVLRGWILLFVWTGMVQGFTQIRDIARPLGERSNKLWNWGIVVGLNGNGDGGNSLITMRPLMTMLQKMGNPGEIDDFKNVKNAALVMVTVEMPRNGVRSGDKLDVIVSSQVKAKSLEGGILLMTPLRSNNYQDDTTYAWAQGPIVLESTDNPTTGVVKGGGIVEVDFIHDYVETDAEGRIFFDLILDENQASWQAAHTVAISIEVLTAAPDMALEQSYLDTDEKAQRKAYALDPRTVRVYIPEKQARYPASFIQRVMSMVVELPDPEATITINEQTGTIVATGNVEIAPCAVHVKDLTIRIMPTPPAGAGGLAGQETEWPKMATANESSANIDDLIRALDQLKVPVQKKIDAIYALDRAGVLRARIQSE